MLGCEGDGNAGVVSGVGEITMRAYMGGTRGSGVLSSAGNVPEMSVVRGLGGVCNMCKCLARGGVGCAGCEWVIGLGLGFINSGRTWGKWVMCLCFGCGDVGGVGENGWAAGAGSGRVGCCYVCVCCES